MWLCVHESRCPQGPEVLGPFGARITGGCEPSDVGAKNQT